MTITARLLTDVRATRLRQNVSQRSVAKAIGWSAERYRRFESGVVEISVLDICTVAAVLGLELSASLYAAGEGLVDKATRR